MSTEYRIGLIFGVVFGLLLVILLLKITKKDGSIKCKFDERQEMARGRAFKYGFFTLMICNGAYALLDEAFSGLPVTGSAASGIIIVIGAGVMISYSIWQDAYFSLNENRKRLMAVFGILGLVNLALGIFGILDGRSFQNGVVNFQITNLLCAVLFLIIFVELAAKQVVDGRSGEN